MKVLKPESRLTFEGEELDVYHINGQRWLRLAQICATLGIDIATGKRIFKAYRRQFTPTMTQIVTVPTPGGPQQVRVFSPRGATLIAVKSNSPKAAEVCVYVLDVLEGKAPPMLAAASAPALPPVDALQAEVLALRSELQATRAEMLAARPLWAKILRYLGAKLTRLEMAKLLNLSKDTVRDHIRRMEACGILTPPANLAAMQGNAANFARLPKPDGQ